VHVDATCRHVANKMATRGADVAFDGIC
jgi:hypothetical protein